MSSIRRIDPKGWMSQAVVHGDTVYLAGQVSAGDNVREQTAGVLRSIDAVLAQVGSDKSKLLTATVYLADVSTFQEMNASWLEWVDSENPPARATVEAKLAAPELLVEISVIAAL